MNDTSHLPDEVITLDIEPQCDFEIEVAEEQPRSLRSLEEMGGDLYKSLRLIRKEIQNKQREENTTMLDANIHTTFDLHIIEPTKEHLGSRVGRFASKALAEKVARFYKTEWDIATKIIEEKVCVSVLEFVMRQGKQADAFLHILSPTERSSFLKRRALSKLTPEEREVLGLS